MVMIHVSTTYNSVRIDPRKLKVYCTNPSVVAATRRLTNSNDLGWGFSLESPNPELLLIHYYQGFTQLFIVQINVL